MEKKYIYIYIYIYTFSNIRNLLWSTNIRLADLAEASKFIIGPFRSYIIRQRMRYGKPLNDYLYKTALSRRLVRFHQPGDVVYAKIPWGLFYQGF